MWRATVKSLFARKVRLALTALSIVLGVGFMAGTYVLTDTMNKAFDELFSQVAGGSDLIVRSENAFAAEAGPGGGGEEREPLPDRLAGAIEDVDGVGRAVGEVQGYAQLIDPGTGDAIGAQAPTFGGNWVDLNPALQIREGRPPQAADEVIIDAATAERYAIAIGDRVTVLSQTGRDGFTVTGIVGFGDADNLLGATLALFDTPTAQRVLDREGEFDMIEVVASEGTDINALQRGVSEVLPGGVEVVTSATVADEQSEQIQEALGFFRTALLVFAFIALFVGAFIIFNTFSIVVAQRSRELALLRAIGASRRQVMLSVVLEAFLVGLFASAVGIAVGIAIAIGLRTLMEAAGIDLPQTGVQLTPRTIVVSLVVGTLVTMVASVLPARRASRVAPVEAMRALQEADAGVGSRRRLAIGLVVTVLGIGALLFGLFGGSGQAAALVGLGAAATFIGVTICSPLVARPLAGFIGLPLRGRGVPGRLGRRNAMRNPRRTASTAAALMIGLGLVSMVAVFSASLKASLTSAVERSLRADLIVSSPSFNAFSPKLAEAIRNVDGVEMVSEFRSGGMRVGEVDEFSFAVDPATVDAVMDLGASPDAFAALGRGEVLVEEGRLEAEGWEIGQEIPTAFPSGGKHPLTVGGVFTQDDVTGGAFVISLDTFDEVYEDRLDDVVMATVAPGEDVGTVQSAVEQAAHEYGSVDVQNQAEFRDRQAALVDGLLGLVTALLAMAILIALFGIVNTLGLSIFERQREIGLLRAVGLSRLQAKRMIRWESVIIAILGAVMGIAIGLFFGVVLQQALKDDGVSELVVPVGQLLIYAVFAGLAGVVAAIWPARRAAKLNVLEAISYE